MSGNLRYAYLDECPVVFNDDKAFQFTAGRWKPLHLAEAMSKARLLSKAEYDTYAGGIFPSPIQPGG